MTAPLSSVQHRLWFLERLAPGSGVHCVPSFWRWTGPLDPRRLERAFAAAARQHTILRTRFVEKDGEPSQEVCDECPVSLSLLDVQHRADPKQAAVGWLQSETARGFENLAPPMFRGSVATVAPDDHIVALTAHHLIADARSMEVLRRDIRRHYEADGQPAPGSVRPSLQYEDFAARERNEADRSRRNDDLEFWRHSLADLPRIPLVTDRARPTVQSFNGGAVAFEMSEATTSDLRRLAADQRATMAMTLLAIFAVVLRRYSGSDDLPIGTPVSTRTRAELENMIGPFIDTAVLRLKTSAVMPFRDLLRATREACLDAFERTGASFGEVVEALRPARDRSRSPLFDVLFSFDANPRTAGQHPARSTSLVIPQTFTRFDVTLRVLDLGASVCGTFEYNRDLFDRWRIQGMADLFQHVAAQVVANSETPLRDLDRRAERTERATTAAVLSSKALPRTVVDQIVARAESSGTMAAVVCDGRTLSFSALLERADALAAVLRARGARPEQFVGLALPRSEWLVVAMLGILRSGAGFVPMDPEYPIERLIRQLEDTDPVCLLVDGALAERLPARFAARILDVDDWQRAPSAPHALPIDPAGRAAYAIYTSGSTGRPKGVVVDLAALTTFADAIGAAVDWRPGDRHVAVTTLSFDIAILELLVVLSCGATIAVASVERGRDGRALSDLLAGPGRSSLQTTPSRWDLLMRTGLRLSADVRVLSGGEVLPASLAGALLASGAKVANLYGPTEATIWATVHELQAGDDLQARQVPIGAPLRGYAVYVLDCDLRPVGEGIRGELWLAGAGLARGYLSQPGATAARFVADPQGPPGSRMYRTGDVAWRRPDGQLEFVGRNDRQVKVRGVRVEPDEIEAAILSCPLVAAAGVRVDCAPDGDVRLSGYAVPKDPRVLDQKETRASFARAVREFCQAHLPEPFVPAVLVPLDAMPLTPAGKIDRLSLSPPRVDEADPPRRPIAPHERLVAGVFSELLGRPSVSLDDSFFLLGGHSLLAVRAIAALENVFGLQLSITDVFNHPTVAGLAAVIERRLVEDVVTSSEAV